MSSSAVKHGDRRPTRAADDTNPPQRGHRSFSAAFEEALRVSSGGVSPQEIRVRRTRQGDSFTWTVRY